jgi:hypothetical protein
MKIINRIIAFVALSIAFISCIKNDPVLYTGAVVEWDAATWNSNNAYVNPPDSIAFPILTRRPPFGRAATSADATLTRTSGNVSLRVNLVGAPRKSATTVTYNAITNYTLIGTPPANNSAAVSGTHYTALSGSVTIPADSSFGYVIVPVLDPGPGTGTRELVLRLNGNSDVKANRNYSVVGLRISQP